MLIWVCALHCEAKPVIDYYRLKKSHLETDFDIYRGSGMCCLISGIGKVASATASAWIAARHAEEPSLAWINLGIAGAGAFDIGKAFLLDKIVDADSGQSYYPVPLAGSQMAGSACLTLSLPGENYRDDTLFDMEASGFIYSALRFSSAELTQAIKIVSDNRVEKTGKNRQRVSDLIHRQIESIDRQAVELLELDREVGAIACSGESWQRLISLAHFTPSQKNRLRVLWRYLSRHGPGSETLLSELARERSPGAIIEALERFDYRDKGGCNRRETD